MYVVVWEFRVRSGAEEKFVAGYGSSGSWAQLFRRAEQYIGTELARNVEDVQIFYTLDRWRSEADYAAFRRDFREAYEALDNGFEGLTEHERLIGKMSLDESLELKQRGEEEYGEGEI